MEVKRSTKTLEVVTFSPEVDELLIRQVELRRIRRKALRTQIGISILASLATLTSGLGLGFPSITLETLKSCENKASGCLSNDQISWFASAHTIACPFGGLLCALLLDKIGRKLTLMAINCIAATSWMAVTFASRTNQERMFIQLLISRALIGITVGLATSPAAVYSAEISFPEIRGRVTVFTSMIASVGILIAYLLGYLLPNDWRLVGAICCCISVCAFLILIPLPESPSWLLSKTKRARAEKNMKLFRGVKTIEEVAEEFENLVKRVEASKGPGPDNKRQTFRRKFLAPEVYKPFILLLCFFAFQQFSGVFVMIAYATRMATIAGVPLDPNLFTVVIGCVRVMGTCLGAFLLDKLGRKKPAIISGFGIAVSMFGLALLKVKDFGLNGILSAILLLFYTLSATFGFHIAPFAISAEIYPRKFKGVMCGLSVSGAYIFCFAALKTYAFLTEVISDSFIFLFFAIVAILGCIFIGVFIPETKGKRLEEIEEYFRH